MEKSITFEPIMWRLMVWIILPLLVGWLTATYAYQLIYPDSSFDPLASSVGILIGGSIITAMLRKQFRITISGDKISGMNAGLSSKIVTFSLAEVDRSGLHKQSFFEKISGSHTLRSVHGEKIWFPHFVYGAVAVNEIYRRLDQYQIR
jgi:hypothetical protein